MITTQSELAEIRQEIRQLREDLARIATLAAHIAAWPVEKVPVPEQQEGGEPR